MWKEIRGMDSWEVSDKGEVRHTSTGRLKYAESHNGYLRTEFKIGGIRRRVRVHRLVAEAFIPNPEGKLEVNHINGNKADNRVENLEWATTAENIRHAYATGLMDYPRDKCVKYATQLHNPSTGSGMVLLGTREIREAGFNDQVISIHVNKPGKLRLHKGHTVTPIWL